MTMTVSVPMDEVLKVQKADIECSAHRDIITHILEKDIQVPSDRFAKYEIDYQDKYFAFEKAKTHIEKTYVRTAVSNPKNWTLDYTTGELTIHTLED